MTWLVQPLQYAFMQRGMLAALLVGIICAVVGCYVVLKSMAFLGDALAHAILPGIAVAYLLNANLTLGALIAALLVALGIGYFSSHGTIKEDTVIGILFAAALALGVAIISSMGSYAVDLSHILFGNVLGVSSTDLVMIAVVGLIVLTTILLFYKQFLLVSFDPVLAATMKLPVHWLRNLLLVLIGLTIVISIQTVGVGLVAAMLVTPGAAAYLLTRRLPTMMLIAALIGALSSVIGLYLSYYTNIVSGSAIVLVATAFFLLAFVFAPQRGLLARRRMAR